MAMNAHGCACPRAAVACDLGRRSTRIPRGAGLVNSAEAGADATAVIAAAGGNGADWLYNLTYSSASTSNSMAGWINDRKENQIDLSIATASAANDIDGIALKDPIDDVDDPSVIKWLNQWKGGHYTDKGGVYPPLTLASTRMMHIILAENALASGNDATFTEHINHIRALDGLTPFSGQIENTEMLQHMRRVYGHSPGSPPGGHVPLEHQGAHVGGLVGRREVSGRHAADLDHRAARQRAHRRTTTRSASGRERGNPGWARRRFGRRRARPCRG